MIMVAVPRLSSMFPERVISSRTIRSMNAKDKQGQLLLELFSAACPEGRDQGLDRFAVPKNEGQPAIYSPICIGFILWVSFITLSRNFIFCVAALSIGFPSSASKMSFLSGSINSRCTARSRITCVSRSAVV